MDSAYASAQFVAWARRSVGPVELKVRWASEAEILANYGPVVIRILDRGPTELEHIDRMREIFEGPLADRPAVGLLVVVHHDTPLPSAATRRHASQLLDELGDRCSLAVAAVGMGFWASAMRATATGLSLLLRRRLIFETELDRAAQRLSAELVGIDPVGIVAAHDQLYADLQRRGVPA